MHKEEPQKILLFSHNMNLSHAECYGMKLIQFHQQSPCNSLLARIKCNNFLLTVKTEVFGHDTTQLDISPVIFSLLLFVTHAVVERDLFSSIAAILVVVPPNDKLPL